MDKKVNYYQLLHVQPDAPVEIVQSSYRALMQKLKQHPDLGGDPQHAALLNKAYAVLNDTEKRLAYDHSLSAGKTIINKKEPRTQNHSCFFCLAKVAANRERCYSCHSPLKLQSHQTFNETNMDSQRVISRFKKEGAIFIHTHWPSQPKEANLLDLSLAGLKFSLKDNLAINKHIKINSPFLSAIARTTRCSNAGSSIYQIGAEFITLEFIDKSGTFISTSI